MNIEFAVSTLNEAVAAAKDGLEIIALTVTDIATGITARIDTLEIEAVVVNEIVTAHYIVAVEPVVFVEYVEAS